MDKCILKFNLKQTMVRFCKFAVLAFLLFQVEKTFAQQPSRIAIIDLADSNLIYKHIGFTVFKDKSDTFDCQFNCKQYIKQELTRVLSTRYTVSLISAPDKLIPSNGSIYNLLNGNNDIKSWISGLKNQYDFVIFVETGEEDDLMDTKKQKLRSCGLYTRGNPAKSWAAVFSTTRITAIRTANSEVLEYDWKGMDYLLPISDYQFSRQNLLIDPEMLPVIRTGLVKLVDYKLEYFLTNSYLLPNVDYESLKKMKEN
ncbi:MAG: hypothetical protein Q7U54_14945 [Bacteroidales bacterium]|nr:hypothetical protein [Bacteroidales bacterium]